MKLKQMLILLITGSSCFAQTNLYLNVSDEEYIRRINAVTNLESQVVVITNNIGSLSNDLQAAAAVIDNLQTEVFSAGTADIGFPAVEVSAAFSSTTWTNIDLSSYIGTNSALVMLRVKDNSAANNDVAFRKSGETIDVGVLDGTSCCQIDASKIAYLIVPSGTNGVIEGKVDASCSITLSAFIRRHEYE